MRMIVNTELGSRRELAQIGRLEARQGRNRFAAKCLPALGFNIMFYVFEQLANRGSS